MDNRQELRHFIMERIDPIEEGIIRNFRALADLSDSAKKKAKKLQYALKNDDVEALEDNYVEGVLAWIYAKAVKATFSGSSTIKKLAAKKMSSMGDVDYQEVIDDMTMEVNDADEVLTKENRDYLKTLKTHLKSYEVKMGPLEARIKRDLKYKVPASGESHAGEFERDLIKAMKVQLEKVKI